MGYHTKKIERGEFGEVSKIQEELEELIDALDQNNKIMALCELADMYGAMNGFLQKHFDDITIEDIAVMAEATKRAFEDGDRLPKDS